MKATVTIRISSDSILLPKFVLQLKRNLIRYGATVYNDMTGENEKIQFDESDIESALILQDNPKVIG